TGTIVGVVEDASGAVIPNAQVTVRQTATGDTRKTVTTGAGEFHVPFLQVGPYAVAATTNGFKTKTITGITLQADQTITLQRKLWDGTLTVEVEGTGAELIVVASTSSLGQEMNTKMFVDMPLNGRIPFSLGLLSGNTTPMFGMGSNLPFIAGGGRFSA